MTQKTLSKSDLRQFTGTDQWYRHGLARNVLYTDGVQHVAEAGGDGWD
jgi:prepilin-type processing-associated H-X9-DG protein